MANLPDTQISLILRLPKSTLGQVDQAAWLEFTNTYEPFLYRFACRRGFQDCDARELVQRVLLSVANSIGRWQPYAIEKSQEYEEQPEVSANARPRFRNWLFTIARNQTINLLKSKRADLGVGGTTQLTRMVLSIDQRAESASLEDDYRYEVFLWAVATVKKSVADDTWQAFWKTAVQQEPCAQVAAELKLSVGSVYAARSRVLSKLKAQVETMRTAETLAEDFPTSRGFDDTGGHWNREGAM